MSYILEHLDDGLLTLTIDRPEALNALNSAVISALSDAIGRAQEDAAVRVIAVTGSGEKAFVAGADIKEFAGFGTEEGRELAALGQERLFNRVECSAKPVIAAIHGYALGGGLELAMAAHIRIAASTARLGLPEVSLGVIPGYGGTQRLPQLVGKGKAMEMILTGRPIGAEEALHAGLVNQVVAPEDLFGAVRAMADRIRANSPTALDAAIQAVLAGYASGVDGFEAEIACFGSCFGTPDFLEETAAFLEKRKPVWP